MSCADEKAPCPDGGQKEVSPAELSHCYRMLPSVEALMLTPECRSLEDRHGRNPVLLEARRVLDDLRTEIRAGKLTEEAVKQKLALLADGIGRSLSSGSRFSLRRVINATGVILHTNLGRAPLSEAALDHIVEVARAYCNLELDLETSERSRRDLHAEELLLRVLRARDEGANSAAEFGVVIVNNCAAATFLALNSLGEGKEVVVSRGELVEIGGGFRIPEILEKSGAILKETGTTNRTRMGDYERAITPNTGLLLRVHPSNFSMDGFVERPSLEELVALSRQTGIPLFEDHGTGLLCSLQRFGISRERTLRHSFESGVDLIAASGDKLLGGPQCGILVGRKDLIARIRSNPLLRTFRVDKLTYAALEATLLEYSSEMPESIPVIRMLSARAEEIRERCHRVAGRMHSKVNMEIIPVSSVLGGGTAPNAALQSYAISLRHPSMSALELLPVLRRADPPVLGRIAEERVLLDLRTVHPREDEELGLVLQQLM